MRPGRFEIMPPLARMRLAILTVSLYVAAVGPASGKDAARPSCGHAILLAGTM